MYDGLVFDAADSQRIANETAESYEGGAGLAVVVARADANDALDVERGLEFDAADVYGAPGNTGVTAGDVDGYDGGANATDDAERTATVVALDEKTRDIDHPMVPDEE